MTNQLGRMEIDCDAPAYTIVAACKTVGFQAPLDVRWLRMGRFLGRQGGKLASFARRLFFGHRPAHDMTCTCGKPLPTPQVYRFQFASEKVADYVLGQCVRCRTIFWEQR